MTTALGSLTEFATWCYSQLGAIMDVISGNAPLFIVIFGMGIVGFGVSLLKRLVRV